MIYIYHHLGLGDHIICNGLIRNIINHNEEYSLFVKPHNFESVRFMYRDIPNLSFILSDDKFCVDFLKNKEEKIIIGFDSCEGISWDEFFYFQHNIDFSNRWDSFKLVRDLKRESILYEKLNPKDEEFILIHSKGSDNIDRINYNFLDKNIKKIFVEKHTDNIFDYLTLIEKSKEIHCIESSFQVMVDSFELSNDLYFHNNFNSRGFQHKIKNKWKII
jgi:hypothetical protein